MPERSQRGKSDEKLPKILRMFEDEEKEDKPNVKVE